MKTMWDPMKSEYVAVLRGDPVLLNRITPVVDQRRHLWQRLETECILRKGGQKPIFINENIHSQTSVGYPSQQIR